MPTNRAAYSNGKGEKLTIGEAPFPEPKENQIVVKVAAIAINPIDVGQQAMGVFIESYPALFGADVAGTVVSSGPGVTDFLTDERVFGHCIGYLEGNQASAAFQEYTILDLPCVAIIPPKLSFEEAVVSPLAINTASAGLFEEDKLGLVAPPGTAGKGKVLFIWGGSSSIGCTAIQLATASGYEVIAAASKRNHDFCMSLGASKVVDYNDSDMAQQVIDAVKGKEFVGAFDAIGHETTTKTTCKILAKSGGIKKIASTMPGTEQHVTDGVYLNTIFGTSPAHNDIGKKVWAFLPKALAEGSFKAKPDPVSAGKGVESIQAGIDMLQKGVSAQKVIVTI